MSRGSGIQPARPLATNRSAARSARVVTMTPVCENRAERCTNNSRKTYFPSLQRTLANRNYAKLWYGQAASAIGDTVFCTTLVLWVSQVLARGAPWAPAAVSGILVAAGIAIALVGPVAGVFVDRWNRKSTMMRTEVIRAVMVAGPHRLVVRPGARPPGLAVAVRRVPGRVRPERVRPVLQPGPVRDDRRRGARGRGPGAGRRPGRGHARRRPRSSARRSRRCCCSPSASSGHWPLNAISYVVSYLAIRFLRLAPEAYRPPRPEGALPACGPSSPSACGSSRATGSWSRC